MSVKLLTEHNLEFLSLKEGYTGSTESTHIKMSHCRKSHALANFTLFLPFYRKYKEIFAALLPPPPPFIATTYTSIGKEKRVEK